MIDSYDFTEPQAEAIVMLQLYRLTNTDVTQLQAEFEDLANKIANYNEILSDPKALRKVLKAELQAIKKEYNTPRRTSIEAEVQELKIDQTVTVADEDVVMLVSRAGYVKRASVRSYTASGDENGLRDDDEPVFVEKVNTLQHAFIFTNKGNVIYRPVHELPEFKWKDAGEHLSQTITGLANDEVVIDVRIMSSVDNMAGEWVVATSDGLIKRTPFADLAPRSTYKKKATMLIKLKSDDATVVGLELIDDKKLVGKSVVLASENAMGLRYSLDEVPTTGNRTAGVKAMNLEAGDRVVKMAVATDKQAIAVVSNRGAFKWMPVTEISATSRGRKGVAIMRELKKDPHRIAAMMVVDVHEPTPLTVMTDRDKQFDISPKDHPMGQRYSNGSFIIDVEAAGTPVRMHAYVQPLVLN